MPCTIVPLNVEIFKDRCLILLLALIVVFLHIQGEMFHKLMVLPFIIKVTLYDHLMLHHQISSLMFKEISR